MASIQQGPNGPVLVLKESALQQKGKDAQQNNIAAAKLVAELVKSSLGPRGLDKMLVDSLGDVTITNDGATILKEIDVQHPAAKMIVEISKTVDNEVGDGTTSSVVFGGALLARAEDLLKKDVHSSTIIEGFQAASEKVLEIYSQLSKKVEPDDKATLLKIASTSMQSKLISEDSSSLSKIVVDAILSIATKKGDEYFVDLENIKVEKKPGGSIDDTQIVKGIVLDKEIVHSGMPTRIDNASIALINSALEIEKTEMSAEIRITDPTQMQMFLEEENRMLKTMVDKLHDVGANVLICQKGIDDIAQHYLAKHGIMAVRRVKESDMIKLSKATDGRVISNLDDLTEKDLGSADLAHQKKVESDKWVFIEGCKHPQSVTLLIRGGTQRVIDEVDRSIHDSLMVVKDVIEKPEIVAGGGAPESFAAAQLKDWADNFDGREQLAIKKYAEALEVIPLTISENAGMDPIDTMATLRSKQNQGQKWTGIDAKNTKIADMMAINVVEPIAVKEQIIKSATEAACMILRIDDVIAVSGGPGGGGGMPPMG
ncbi:thermosome subunit beta [Nitrosopumilus sp.]|jgi:thermosome|nr:thermosome subunit [Nitrosopumilus sp.]MCH1549357.1 TCP-1/cpn60 chaperonin family protein [Nitrosopumilus sp.]MDC0150217.1 thermosome subunit beta [Nitrosopumilus sp.]MDC0208085.1 thermosome subunit beta [Nitrosopumilus sp.]RCL30053.1 MAG: thermosome subunit [Nitrosopumilus sp.]|tara:strand:+ start:4389 stop:6014 length:1626 start_codon:yes stop_codon:yes gene_type:complete